MKACSLRKRLWNLMIFVIVLLLTACSNGRSFASNESNQISPVTQQSTNTSSIAATGTFREYPLPQTGSGLMRPTIDHQGRVWFGEMGRNFLAVFDPHTQQFQQMTPPGGEAGLMGVAVAADDTIWFAEQYANYIGHYMPATQHYQLYRLPTFQVPDPGNANKTLTLPTAPNEITLDAHGNVWFTEMNSDSLGMLDPQTGRFTHYPISSPKTVQTLNPYGLTIDPQGIVWFTEVSSNAIGRLDPTTGIIQHFPLPNATTSLMEIASDQQGNLWATGFKNNLLLKFDPRSAIFTPYYAPFTQSSGGIYGLTIPKSGEIWVTLSSENAIARFDVAAHRFVTYAIPTPASLPLGIVSGSDHTFWFTEAGSNKIGMLKP